MIIEAKARLLSLITSCDGISGIHESSSLTILSRSQDGVSSMDLGVLGHLQDLGDWKIFIG